MFATRTEGDILNAIRNLAGKDESTLVQRIKLNRKTQSLGLGIRPFLVSLRMQASQYKAMCKEPACDHIFDYSEEIIMDHLVREIADSESLWDLQGDPKTDWTSKKLKGPRRNRNIYCP
jgi:hypothetical protein